MDPKNSNVIAFKLDDPKNSNVIAFILDEGASTLVMYLSSWRAIVSPKINRSPMTLNSFNGHGFKPYGLLPFLQV